MIFTRGVTFAINANGNAVPIQPWKVAMKSRRKQWWLRQIRRCRRFLPLLPSLIASPSGVFSGFRELCRIFFFHGFTGLKSYCRTMEEQMKANEHNFTDPDPGKRGYIIVAPNYTPNSAGIAALFRLCDELNRRGFPSYMAEANITNSDLMAPLISISKAQKLCSKRYTAIYHENVIGNPLAHVPLPDGS